MSIAVALFDDTERMKEGYYSLEGGQPVRFSSIAELPQSAIFVTNIDFTSLRKTGLLNIPYVRDNMYFRTSIKHLCLEIGIERESFPTQTQKLSALFSRTHKSLAQKIPIGFPGYRITQGVSELLHSKVTQTHCMEHLNKSLSHIFSNATQTTQAQVGRYVPRGSQAFRFIFPRSAYAKYLLSLRLPTGTSWRNSKIAFPAKVGIKSGVDGRTMRSFTRLCETECGIARISDVQTDPYWSPIFLHGACIGNERPLRNWVTLPEMISMAEHSTFTIEEILTCDGFTPKPIFDHSRLDYSHSDGLAAENIWIGVSQSPQKKPTAATAYIHAYDRILCGKAAALFHANGLFVGSFSTGSVTLMLSPTEYESAVNIALKIGLLPPAFMLQSHLSEDHSVIQSPDDISPLPADLVETISRDLTMQAIKSSVKKNIPVADAIQQLEEISSLDNAEARSAALSTIFST